MNPHSRKSIRLKNHDYTQPKIYFITIRTNEHDQLFGKIIDGKMQSNKYGRIVSECWYEIPKHFTNVQLDAFVVMPDHIHGIIIIGVHVGARHAAPLHEKFGKPISGGIPTIARPFKSVVTKRIREQSQLPKRIVWQRNYYESIIRSGKIDNVREYILSNPSEWNRDSENARIRLEHASLS